MCAWVAQQCSSADSNSQECDDARELSRDLENEILTLLEEHHVTIR